MLEVPGTLAPALVPTGLWLATATGQVQHWPLPSAAGAAWQPDVALQVAPPVHAVQAAAGGAHVLVAHAQQLTLLGAQGEVLRVYDGADLARRRRGSADVLFHLPQRRSFVAAWPALGELWEIALDPAAPPIFDGLVHDYRFGEGLAAPGYLGVRRAPLGQPLPRFVFADAHVPWLAGMLGDDLMVVHLDVRRRVAALPLALARPEGSLVRRVGTSPPQWWVPQGTAVQLVDAGRWTLGPRFELGDVVHELQACGERVLVRCGEGEGARLVVGRDEAFAPSARFASAAAGASLPSTAPFAPSAAGAVPTAMAVQPSAAALLLATANPPALQWLDGTGRLVEQWPLPAGTAVRRVAWLPLAA
jgi:hypothetical protein